MNHLKLLSDTVLKDCVAGNNADIVGFKAVYITSIFNPVSAETIQDLSQSFYNNFGDYMSAVALGAH